MTLLQARTIQNPKNRKAAGTKFAAAAWRGPYYFMPLEQFEESYSIDAGEPTLSANR
jgi:hypothetical protein